MIPARLLFTILGIVVLETISQFTARKYYENRKRYYNSAIAFILYFPVLVLLVYSYNFASFAIANALWDSGTIIAMGLIGRFYFGEPFTTGELIGLSLVVAGALTIGFTSDGGKKKNET